MTGPRDFDPWFADPTIATDLPAWITPYRAYARLRGRDGHRALVASQRVARRLGLQRVGALTVDRTRVFLDLFDTRFPWVIDEIRSTSLQREVIARHLRPGDIFIDAGANHGSFSLLAALAVGKDGVVHAFEPNPFLARLITRSAEANCFTQLRVHATALSAERGTSTLMLGPNSGSNHLYAGPSHRPSTNVPTTTLDTALQAAPLPDRRVVLKMDVEGHERDCLLGASELLAQHRPLIILELNPAALARSASSPAEVISLLVDHGYQHFSNDRESFRCFGPDAVDTDQQQDVVAIPSELLPLLCTAH